MSNRDWPVVGTASKRVQLVASDPVWVGAVKRATLLSRGGSGRWRVEHFSHLGQVLLPTQAERQFLLLEVGHENVEETVEWCCLRRPLASRWRAAVLLSRARGEFSPREIASLTELLREAGAGPLITTPWEIPDVIAWGAYFQASLPQPDPWDLLPVAIAAEGWQPRRGRV